ncbi:MAG: spore maturation protein [Desulfurispora sp.]|uniref:spore maturation protein n=1 Tax=Desulfurispora sp. TaxID=3014275 RepID=UPI00404ABECB
MFELLNQLSRWVVPGLMALVLLVAWLRRVNVFEVFVAGAEQGFSTAVRTIPYLVAMLVAIHIFRASGAMQLMARSLAPWLSWMGLPPELLPHAIMRPLSGGAALGIATDIIARYGPDSFLGLLVSTMQGTSDTTFYVLTLYFGSVGIVRYRYAVYTGLAADLITLLASLLVVRLTYTAAG